MDIEINYKKLIATGTITALAGFLLSGPIAFIIVNLIQPQPAWVSPEVFVEHYSIVQDLPYYFGFLLIGGMLMIAAGIYLDYKETDQKTKFLLLVAFGCTSVFCTLISFNYICQTTFVHNLATHYTPENNFAISTFSMTNPLSFCWANEMWGYGILGIVTILISGYYRQRNRIIYRLLYINGIGSLASVAWVIIDVNWVMTSGGLISYFAWNVLMIVLILMMYRDTQKKYSM